MSSMRIYTSAVLGIDIARQSFDVALRQDEALTATGCFDNDARGFAQLQRWLQRCLQQGRAQEVHACLEATGRYGTALAKYLYGQGYTVSVVNPSRTHAYAKSKLQRIKTDKTDAALLADFCATQQPEPWQPPSPQAEELQALSRHLETLQQTRTRINNRLKADPPSALVRQDLTEQLALTDKQITAAKRQLGQLTRRNAALQHKVDLITSIPALALLSAARFLAEVPDITAFPDADHLAAYAGLTPTQHTSGTSVRKKSSLAKTGNRHLRTLFYMPALCAIRLAAKGHHPLIHNLVSRLEQRGKSKMTIVAAVMRKLIHLVYGVLKSGKPFDPNYAAPPT